MKKWYKNFGIAIGVTLTILIAISFVLDVFTRHGREVEMGNVLGMTASEFENYVDDNSLEIVILDSVFTDQYPKGTVCKQDPKEGDMIKKGRKVYVSYVACQQEMVEMPNLDDLTVRQAVAVVFAKGLMVGELIYQDGFDRNAIQDVRCGGKRVSVGTRVPKGSLVDMYVSRGIDGFSVAVPRVLGLNVNTALLNLFSLGFNVSRVNYDKSCEGVSSDQLGVYRQEPPLGGHRQLGDEVGIWVKPTERIKKSELEVVTQDTITDNLNVNDEF